MDKNNFLVVDFSPMEAQAPRSPRHTMILLDTRFLRRWTKPGRPLQPEQQLLPGTKSWEHCCLTIALNVLLDIFGWNNSLWIGI